MKSMKEVMQFFSTKSTEAYKQLSEVRPMMIVADQSGVTVVAPLQFTDSDNYEKCKVIYRVSGQVRKQILKPLYGIMLTEAWMARVNTESDISNIQPSTHPDRQEILAVSGIDFEYQQLVYLHEIVRDTSGNFVRLNFDFTSAEVHSTLMVAMMDGLLNKPLNHQAGYDGVSVSKSSNETRH